MHIYTRYTHTQHYKHYIEDMRLLSIYNEMRLKAKPLYINMASKSKSRVGLKIHLTLGAGDSV
jgi:hypothetical protein